MSEEEILLSYRNVLSSMEEHVQWLSSGRISYFEYKEGEGKVDITQKCIELAQKHVDELATAIRAHKAIVSTES